MINLTEAVQGDALLAGGQVDIASEVQGDLVVAGGEVSVGGSVGDDLYAAGGNVSVDAIVAGNAIIERPDLFGAAFLNAGYVNVLRGETTANGIANIPEMGSVKTEEG